MAGEVPDFRPADHIEARRVRRFDRFAQFGVAATRLALADAAIDLAREDGERIGSSMGTALAGVARAEEEHGNYMRGGLRAVDPSLALAVFGGAASCNVAIEFGLSGPNTTNGMSCASGTMAIGDGFRAIARGDADVMVSGGTEAPLAPLCFGAFAVIRAMSTRNDDPDHRQPARSIASATASSWPRARRCWCSRSGSGPWRGARRSTRRSAATASPTTPTT